MTRAVRAGYLFAAVTNGAPTLRKLVSIMRMHKRRQVGSRHFVGLVADERVCAGRNTAHYPVETELDERFCRVLVGNHGLRLDLFCRLTQLGILPVFRSVWDYDQAISLPVFGRKQRGTH
jgi:hypothetical protein